MSFINNIIDNFKLNNDYDDDEEFRDESDIEEDVADEDDEDDIVEVKTRKRFFDRFSKAQEEDEDEDEDDEEDDDDAPARSRARSRQSERDASARRKQKEKEREAQRREREREKARRERESARRERENAKREREREKVRQERENARTARKNAAGSRKKYSTAGSMEVNVIRPSSMEDTKEIAENLMNDCTVVLNLEGLDVDIAQRVIDFTCGVCFALDGNLQKVSSYIFIVTPAGVDISGDFQSILNGAIDIPSMNTQYR